MIHPYHLQKEKLLHFLQENLDGTNALSSELLHFLKTQENGKFYTLLLQENILPKNLYAFKKGGVGGSTKSQVANLILKKISENLSLFCLFDDINSDSEEPCNDPIFSNIDYYYGKEVYYCLNKGFLTKELIEKCLYVSSSIWHSLCIISKASFPKQPNKTLSLENLQTIVKNAELVLIGAYDDESYIFWEK